MYGCGGGGVRKIAALALALFVLANLLVTLAYGLLWPYLYDWNIVEWDGEARVWLELFFHGLLALIIGLPICVWLAHRFSKQSTSNGSQ